MAVAITQAITTLAEAEQQFDLQRTESPEFFTEWHEALPSFDDLENRQLSQLRRRYLYQRSLGYLLENTITLLFASPLITIAGFYDPPFQVKAEPSVQIVIEDSEEVLQGRIDVLVLKDVLWVVVLESKKTALSVWSALPQTLAYLMASPAKSPQFAMMTNSDESVFVKVEKASSNQYSVSRVFATLTSTEELEAVLKILKQFGEAAR